MATITYDPAIIQKFAGRLYARASSIIVGYTLAGILFGGLACIAFLSFVGVASPYLVGLLVGGGVGGAIGYAVGSEKAFALKLQAQVALCQLQIEANTRAARHDRVAAA